jgi:hypothetical protein
MLKKVVAPPAFPSFAPAAPPVPPLPIVMVTFGLKELFAYAFFV